MLYHLKIVAIFVVLGFRFVFVFLTQIFGQSEKEVMSFQPSSTYIYIDSNDFAKVPNNKGAVIETRRKRKLNEYCRDYGFDDEGTKKNSTKKKMMLYLAKREDMRVSNINYE